MLRVLDDTAIKPAPNFDRLRKTLLRDGKPDFVPFYELFVDPPVMESALGKKLPDRASTVEFYYRGVRLRPRMAYRELRVGSLIDRSEGTDCDGRPSRTTPGPSPSLIGFDQFESVIPVLPDGMQMIGLFGEYSRPRSLCWATNSFAICSWTILSC